MFGSAILRAELFAELDGNVGLTMSLRFVRLKELVDYCSRASGVSQRGNIKHAEPLEGFAHLERALTNKRWRFANPSRGSSNPKFETLESQTRTATSDWPKKRHAILMDARASRDGQCVVSWSRG